MIQQLQLAIESMIAESTGVYSALANSSRASGGCINEASTIELQDGRRYFVKSNSNAPKDMFEKEAHGLAAMAASETIRVPDVIGWQNGRNGFLVLEAIESSRGSKDYSEEFGRNLARLHQSSSAIFDVDSAGHEEKRCTVESFGFYHDNYLGSTAQPNQWTEDWISFYRDQRLGFQFRLAEQNGHSDGVFSKLADQLQNRLGDLLNVEEPPCLIHGDLWSGNYMVSPAGKVVLFDPAVYFAHREAEFGMTTLFGGFDRRFYAAYEDVWPLADGAEDRIAIYRLYHLLNHLNLFGRSYASECLEIMKKYA